MARRSSTAARRKPSRSAVVAAPEADRYIERERQGRRNRYKVHRELPLRHPIEAHRKSASLIALVVES